MTTVSKDTITALATPSGKGGVAVVRVSGPDVNRVIQHMIGKELAPRVATHCEFKDANGSMLDDGVAIYFPNPHSFTGDDVLELQGHGGPVIVDTLLKEILSISNVRLARPGEFSERAFLNGKLDLTQAEAIADLIDASSQHAARLALRSLQGDFAKHINALNEEVIKLRMFIEASMDFSDEEIDFLADGKVKEQLENIITALNTTLNQAKQGSFLREGINVVIAGEPNVGKSSLLNALSGKETAIVTDIPGTTRDVLRDHILLDDIPLHVVDTAGLRDSDDPVELEGIRRARQEIENADIILQLFTAEKNNTTIHPEAKTLLVRNKIDLTDETPTLSTQDEFTVVSLSAKTGDGIDLLKKEIKQLIGYQESSEGLFLARRRHLDALLRAKDHVSASLAQMLTMSSGDLMAEDLRLAQQALSEITGEFTSDDLLGRIFSSFCIGK